MKKPLYALHRDSDKRIMSATTTGWDHEMSSWLRGLDIRPGDTIEFGDAAERPQEPRDVSTVEPLAIVPCAPEALGA